MVAVLDGVALVRVNVQVIPMGSGVERGQAGVPMMVVPARSMHFGLPGLGPWFVTVRWKTEVAALDPGVMESVVV